jgi:hypothetical protein
MLILPWVGQDWHLAPQAKTVMKPGQNSMIDGFCTRRRWPGMAGAGLVLLLLAGCGARPYPVHGQLQYEDGQPLKDLSDFMVSFTSQELTKSSTGKIEADGTFKLSTSRPDDGAFPGKYKVIVSQPHPNPERRLTRQPVVDEVYENPKTTTLEATVEPKDNTFTFKLRRYNAAAAAKKAIKPRIND